MGEIKMCHGGFRKTMRCGRKRIKDPFFQAIPMSAALVAFIVACILIPIGGVVSGYYRQCECLARNEWIGNCNNGVAYGYSFDVSCPTIETFHVPSYITPCEEFEKDIEKYRWEVGVEKKCWVELVQRVDTYSEPEVINATNSAANITANSKEPVPRGTYTKIGYSAKEITHELKGSGIWIAGIVSFVIMVVAIAVTCIWVF